MTINQFIRTNKILPADAVVLKKKILGMVDHYAIFAGYRGNQAIFIANYRDGVKEVSLSEMNQILEILNPVRIERFSGGQNERKLAVRRAISRIGEKAYGYITNNCEHFKNWVHFGENYSKQVEIAGNVSLGIGTGILVGGIANKNPKAKLLGIGLLLTGIMLKENAEN